MQGMDGVFADEFQGAYEGVCRLIEKRMQKICIAAGQTDHDTAVEERCRGCLQALEDNGISKAEDMVLREAEDITRMFQGKSFQMHFCSQ